MANLINPLDLIFISIILIFGLLGYINGFKNEFKKIISLIFTVVLIKLLSPFLNITSHLFEPIIYYIIIFILFLFLFSVIISSIITYYPLINDSKKSKNIIGAIIGMIKSFLIISIILHLFELSPITNSLKNKIYNKAKTQSVVFKVCDNIKNFLIKNN